MSYARQLQPGFRRRLACSRPRTLRQRTWHCLALAASGLLALSAGQTSAQSRPAKLMAADLERLAHRHALASFDLLREALGLPNDAHFPEHIENNVRWAETQLQRRGFSTRRLGTGGPPLLLAERRSPLAGRTAVGELPAVLIYLQIDGQPVDPARWQQESPYRPVLKERRGERPDAQGDAQEDERWSEIPWRSLERAFDPEWRVFARSAADAKGPAVMFLVALDALAAEGLPQLHHLKVLLDFEEELGSPHLPAAVEQHRDALAADLLLVFDGPRHASNRPTLSFGARGIVDITLTTFGPKVPQHSGHYGNWAPNPAMRLARLMASMKDDRGRVLIPGFYDGVELDDATRSLLRATPDDEEEIRRRLGFAEPDGVAPSYQEALQYPSLNVRGMASAWIGDEARTIVPATATAEIDVRLVPEADAERLVGLIRGHIEGQGYLLLDAREPTDAERARYPKIASFSHQLFYQAYRTPYESAVGRWLTSALRRAFDEEPIRIRMSGGSVPISPFVVELGIPAVGVPTVQRDNNQHSPNENLRLGNYVDGVRTFLSILSEPF